MANPVYIDFAVRGVKNVDRAFKSVFDSIIGAESKFSARTSQFSQKREQMTKREVNAREREYQRLVRQAERWERDEVRGAERAAKAKEKAAEKAAAAETKAGERAAAAYEKAEARKVSARERAAEREFRSLERKLAAEEKAEQRAESRRAKDSAKTSAQREGALRAIGAGTAANMQKLGGVGMGIARGVLNVGGGFSLEDSVNREMRIRGKAADLANAATGSGEARKDTGKVLGNVKAASAEFALDQDDVMSGLEKFTALTGNLDKGMEMTKRLGLLARATGSNFEELAQAAGEVFNADQTMSAETLSAIMGNMAAQGKIGSVDIKDFASQFAGVGAAASGFGGDKQTSISQAIAISQIAKRGGGAKGPAEAAASVAAFGALFSKNSSLNAFEKAGVAITDDRGKRRQSKDIILDSLGAAEKKGKGVGLGFDRQMGLMIASVQARRATMGFENIYKAAGGGQAGRDAVTKAFEEFEKGVMTEADQRRLASARLQEADAKLEMEMQKLRSAVGEKLLPELVKLIPSIAKLVPHLSKLLDKLVAIVDWAAGNPMAAAFAGLGASAALSVGKEMATAGIGKLISNILSGAGGGVGGGAGRLGGGVPTGNAIATTGMAAIAAGTAIAGVIQGSGEGYADGAMATDDIAAKVDAYARGDKTRGISPEHAQQLVAQAKGRLDSTSAVAQAGNIIAAPFSDSAAKDYKQYKADQALVDHEGLSKAIAKALEAGAAMAAPNLAAHPDNPNRNAPLSQRGGTQ